MTRPPSATLSPREVEVLGAKFRGLTHAQAAHALGISEQTFKNHISSIYGKLGVTSLLPALRAMGWIGTTVAEEAIRIAILRVAAREELLKLADAVGSAGRAELLALADAVGQTDRAELRALADAVGPPT